MRILFFLDSLGAGGKERRAIELLSYLKKSGDFDLQIVITEEQIDYKNVLDLDIPILIVKRGFFKKDPLIFYKFFKIVDAFRPDIIHCWGQMTTLYAIPSSRHFKIPLINGQISNARKLKYSSLFFNIIWKINKYYSSLLLANSYAGLKAYNVRDTEGVVIYNGVNLERFKNCGDKTETKNQFKIKTPFMVLMVANYNKNKDYNLFFKVARKVCELRSDTTFVAVGKMTTKSIIYKRIKSEKIKRISLYEGISNVEELVNACDIGILLSNILTGEGISNSILEYMALSKPVIATNSGGTGELVDHNVSGFLVDNDIDFIVDKINLLLDNQKLKMEMGKKGCEIVKNRFNINKMGGEFIKHYKRINI